MEQLMLLRLLHYCLPLRMKLMILVAQYRCLSLEPGDLEDFGLPLLKISLAVCWKLGSVYPILHNSVKDL